MIIEAATVLVYLSCSPQCKKVTVEYPTQNACLAAMHTVRDKDGSIPIVAMCQAPTESKKEPAIRIPPCIGGAPPPPCEAKP